MHTDFDAARFDELYRQRQQPEILAQCQQNLTGLKEGNFEVAWRAARLDHFVAMQTLENGDKSGARKWFESGARHAKNAENLDKNRVEAVFWSAVCELEAARTSGALLLARAIFGAEKRLDRAAYLDESFHQSGPLRVLGRIFHQKPIVLGGNLDRALAFYQRALKVAPDNSTTLLYQADALLADHQPAPARRVLKQILALNPTQDWVWECARDQKIAEKWLKTRLD